MYPVVRTFISGLLGLLALFYFSGCTVKYEPLETGVIPKVSPPTPEESEYGERLFQSLLDDYQLVSSHPRYEQLTTAFDHLVKTAEADHLAWQLHVLEDPEIVDVFLKLENDFNQIREEQFKEDTDWIELPAHAMNPEANSESH